MLARSAKITIEIIEGAEILERGHEVARHMWNFLWWCGVGFNRKMCWGDPLGTVKSRIESLRLQYQRLVKNLDILEQRKARYGLDVPLTVLNEIDYHKEEIERIKAELSLLVE